MEVAVIQSDGLVPVVPAGGGGETVPRSLGGILIVGLFAERKRQRLTWIIVEIVLRPPVDGRVVSGAERLDFRPAKPDLAVVPRHVVGHEIDQHLQTVGVRAAQQRLELRHPFRRIISEIRIDIEVIHNRIRRAEVTFDDVLVGSRTAGRPESRRMPYHPGEPNVRDTERAEIFKARVIDGGEFPPAPLTRQNLIDDFLAHNADRLSF